MSVTTSFAFKSYVPSLSVGQRKSISASQHTYSTGCITLGMKGRASSEQDEGSKPQTWVISHCTGMELGIPCCWVHAICGAINPIRILSTSPVKKIFSSRQNNIKYYVCLVWGFIFQLLPYVINLTFCFAKQSSFIATLIYERRYIMICPWHRVLQRC